MNKETRTDFQVWSAIGMLVAGVALSVAGFCVPPVGEISDSVLWFFAQCLIYAGSIFGVSIYVQSKFSDIKERLAEVLGSPLQPPPPSPPVCRGRAIPEGEACNSNTKKKEKNENSNSI